MTSLPVLKLSDFTFSEMKALFGLVTPSLAAELLALNMQYNRPVSQPLVKKYACLMQSGEWVVSSPIEFTKEGVLINGQHRLSAVIASGRAQPFSFLMGHEQKTAEVMDQGKNRSASDILFMRNVKLGRRHVAIIRTLHLVALGYKSHYVLSPPTIASLCEIYEERLRFCTTHSNKQNAIQNAPVFSAVALAYPHENHDRLLDFLECWHTGTVKHGVEDNPAILLRSVYFSSNKGDVYTFALKAQTALSAFLQKKNISMIKAPSQSKWSIDEFKTEALLAKVKEFEAKRSADL